VLLERCVPPSNVSHHAWAYGPGPDDRRRFVFLEGQVLMNRGWRWGLGALAVLSLCVVLGPLVAERSLRRVAEQQLNACVKGYTARIGRLELRPLTFSVHVRDLQIEQDANPVPPITRIPRIATSLQLAAMMRGRLVARVLVDDARVAAQRVHVLQELESPIVVVENCTLLRALRALYAINLIQLRNGTVEYVDGDHAQPLALRALNVDVRDIRIARSEQNGFPSPVTVDGLVFDDGRVRFTGAADPLRKPYAAVKGRIELVRIGFDRLGSLAAPYGLRIMKGSVGAAGNVEYSPDSVLVDLEYVEVDGLQADYVYRRPTLEPAKAVAKQAAAKAEEVANAPNVVFKARRVDVTEAAVGFVNEGIHPRYRVFLDRINVQMENFGNRLTEGAATARVTARFMGSGKTLVTAALRPEHDGPDFDLATSIEDTDLRQMNDLVRAHARIDLTSGLFSVYSELRVKNGRVTGYVKPLIRDLKAYEAEEDREKGLGQRIKEKAVNITARLLRNRPRKELAAVAPLEGPLENPKANTWETMISVVQNAFFKAILPGFVPTKDNRGASDFDGRSRLSGDASRSRCVSAT
jgi:hypothetical protein